MDALPAAVRVAIARFLTREDVIQWLLVAVETNDRDLQRVLRYESAYPLAQGRAHVVHGAASTGSLVALATLFSSSRNSTRPFNTHSARRFVSCYWSRGFPEWVLHAAIQKIPNDDDAMAVVQFLAPRMTYYHAPRTMILAARRRRLDIAQWIADEHNRRYESPSLDVIVPFNDTVQVLHWNERHTPAERGMWSWSRFATHAHGMAGVSTCFRNAPVPLCPAMDYAASIGDLGLLQALHNDPRVSWPCSTEAMDTAATRGDLAMVQWLYLNRKEGCSPSAMDGAAANGHYDMVRWLYHICQVRGTTRAFDGAAGHGHSKVLKWLNAKFPHCQVSTAALEGAARGGFLDVLEWVHETKAHVRVTPAMLQNAVNGGHWQVVQWLVEKDRSLGNDPRRLLTPHLLLPAAASGNLAMLQWLWDEFQVVHPGWLSVAVEHGQLPTVEWLLRSGVLTAHEIALKRDVLYGAATRGHWRMLEYVLVHLAELCLGCALVPRDRLRKTLQDDASASWLPGLARVVLRLLPVICAHEDSAWLVDWAASHALEDILEQVWPLHRNQIRHKRLVGTVVKCMASSAASRVVGAIVRDHPETIDRRMVQWAATYAHVALLDTILTQMRSEKRGPFFRTVLSMACRHGQVAVLAWVRCHRQQLDELEVDVWRGAAGVAARHDQQEILQYVSQTGHERSED
jgi:hypothetical protein